MDYTDNDDDKQTEDEVQEPQITSLDPNERKLARKLRIQRRAEAVRKAKLPPGEEEPEIIEKTSVEQQVERSWEVLERLVIEGEELVTNVRVATDTREVDRRVKENATRERTLKMLEDEASDAYDKFNAINLKWNSIIECNDPLDIQYSMMHQKVKCDELIAQKDAIISELKEELSFQDMNFTIDQRTQTEDIAILCQRVDQQVDIMRRAYRNELKLIEEVIIADRLALIEQNNKKWEKLYRQRDEQEETNMIQKLEQMKDQEEKIHRLLLEHQEKYRETKIQLEIDVQTLQEELQKMKALCLLNGEKLDYNFLILKRREDENLLSKSNQKKRINKLQDIVNDLRTKMREYDTQSKAEIAKLTDEVIKLNASIQDIETKSSHFTKVNDKIFRDIWELNRDEGVKLLNKILSVDKVLYEQQLGIMWIPPEKELIRKEELPSYKTALQSQISTSSKSDEKSSLANDGQTKGIILRQLLHQVSDKSEFLIEKRLLSIMEPFTDNEKEIIRLDNVFSALDVTSEGDMDALVDYFLPYAYCSVCSSELMIENLSESEVKVDEMERDSVNLSISARSRLQFESKRTIVDTYPLDDDKLDIDTIVDKAINDIAEVERPESIISISGRFSELFDTGNSVDGISAAGTSKLGQRRRTTMPDAQCVNKKESFTIKIKCNEDHILSINPAYVLRGLRNYVAYHIKANENETIPLLKRLTKTQTTLSRVMTSNDMSTFWDRFIEVFSVKRLKVWETLYMGLQDYYEILKERHNLGEEIRKLRKENAEMKRLLKNTTDLSLFSCELPPIPCVSSGSILSLASRSSKSLRKM